jgi:hypothetical protein
MSYVCRDCLDDIGNGEAILRSVSFRVVAYCRPCWDENHAEFTIPAQRRSLDDAAEARQRH